jgi:hypothetical protein
MWISCQQLLLRRNLNVGKHFCGTKVLVIIYDRTTSHHLTFRVSPQALEIYFRVLPERTARGAQKKIAFFLRDRARGDEQEVTASCRGGNRVDRHTTLLWSELAVLPIFPGPFGS